MAVTGILGILFRVSVIFILIHAAYGKGSFERGNKRRAASYLTNPELTESSCFDGEDYANKLKEAREKCDLPVCSRGSTDERCLNRKTPEWMRSCGVVQRLFKGCDYSSKPLKKVAQNRQSVCQTTAGTNCQIPWVYKGRVYRGCSTVDFGNTYWCHDDRGDDPNNYYGVCAPGCPQDNDGIELNNFCHTTVDQPCKFPFTYKGKKYNGCTDVDVGSYWCEDNLGRTLTSALCDDFGTVCKAHNETAGDGGDDGGFEILIPKDEYCFLRRMNWIFVKQFKPDEVQKSVDTIKDKVVKECFNYALKECKKAVNQEFTVDGKLADIEGVEYLACVDNRFTRFCNRRLEMLLQSISKS